MHLVDHLFVLLLFVVQPINGAIAFRRYIRKIEAGEPSDRLKLYRQTLLLEWVAFAALAAAWFYFGRPVAALGFTAPGGANFWIGAALLLLVVAFLVRSLRSAKGMSDEEKGRQAASLGDLVHFLPHTDRDYRSFVGVSITAGIVEETIYRGFVFWYLAHYLPLWAVVAVSSLAFGLGHSYQGIGGVVRVSLVGIAMGAFYVLTGSIWLPILGHALLDIVQGATLMEILRNQRSHSGKPPSSSGSTISTRPVRSVSSDRSSSGST